MSRFRNIWAKAIEANQALALKRPGAEATFDRLLFEYAGDGMVHYERGEAFEYLGDLDRAEADYKRAVEVLPLPHWKAIAQRAVARVQDKRSGGSGDRAEPSAQWRAFHAVHAAPRAPHKLRLGALFAIQRIDSEPGSSATSLRRCVDEIERGAGRLRSSIPDTVQAHIDIVRKLGDKGAHEYTPIHQYDIDRALDAFVAVLDWASTELWSRSRKTA